jgi:hypothetical protein
MALRFRYKLVPVANPVIALGGRFVRPRPLIPVTLIGPSGTYVTDGVLDPAADDTIFPTFAATSIGLDLTNAPTRTASGVGSGPLQVRYARPTLRTSDGKEHREWEGWVGFSTARTYRPLLGFAGFLQFFDASFFGALEEVELAVNALYPGI